MVAQDIICCMRGDDTVRPKLTHLQPMMSEDGETRRVISIPPLSDLVR